MKTLIPKQIWVLLALITLDAAAVTRYVDLNNPSPTPPYTSWTTAATNIQEAVDAAEAGDLVLVTNGVHLTGSRLTSDSVQNRVVVTNSITLQSVNGPTVTSIDGSKGMRCVYLTNGAVLAGFTLSNGKGGNGGGAFCSSVSEVLSNCNLLNNSGVNGGGVFSGTLNNCTLSGNSSGNGPVDRGGGAYGSVLNDCIISGNKCGNNGGNDGGGAFGCTLNYCTVYGNSVNTTWGSGGGACNSMLNSCTAYGNSGFTGGGAAYSVLDGCSLFGNTATYGGGVASSTLTDCIVNSNTASGGGGSYWSTLYNCQLIGNICYQLDGGGASRGSLVNCVVVGNKSGNVGGGVSDCGVLNSIVYNNASNWGGENYDGFVNLNYCCTTPLPSGGAGNISGDPLFVNLGSGDYHLQTNSPCIEAGNNSYVSVTNDFEGNPRIIGAAVDMGAFEFQSPTYIALQPQNQTVFGDYTAVFNVIVVSPLPLIYQWMFNGVNIIDATNSTLSIANLIQTNTGDYNVVVYNGFASFTSSNAALSVIFPAPTIIISPTNQSVVLGSNTEFSVTTFSPYPMAFQWLRYGTNLVSGGRISGAMNPVLDISSTQTGDVGPYHVIITNRYGAVTSSIVSLTVLGSPIFLAPPSNVVTMAYNTANLSVIVSGAPPLFFQWRKDGTNLVDAGVVAGSATPILTISNPQTTDTGQYSVMVSNSFGTNLTNDATLTVVPIVAWVWGDQAPTPPPEATNVIAIAVGFDWFALRGDGTVVEWGGNAQPPPQATNVMAIAAGESGALALRRDGTVVTWPNSTAAPPDLTNIVAVAAGYNYYLVLRNDGTIAAWSDDLFYDASQPPGMTNIIAIAAGASSSSVVRQDGTAIGWGQNYYGQITPPSYATNLVAITGGTSHTLALREDGVAIGWGATAPPQGTSNVIGIAAGRDDVLVLQQDGTVTGWGFFGQVIPPSNLVAVVAISANELRFMTLVQDSSTRVLPSFVQSPSDSVPLTGQPTVLISRAIGSFPLEYQWFFDGTLLFGQTNSWLVLPSIRPDQAGSYQSVVTNTYGSATSHVAVVSELSWTTIATQPASQSIVVGSNGTFTVRMFGLPPFYFQWYFNGTPLSDGPQIIGSATDTLRLSNLQTNNTGDFSVTISNSFNSSTSQLAALTVLIPAGIAVQPTNQNILVNSNAVFAIAGTGDNPLEYQWRKDGLPLGDSGRISGATTPTLVIAGGQTTDSGDYQAVVANNSGAVTSLVATLSVYVPAQIITQPESIAIMQGSNAQFTVAATGTAPEYQWFFNGAALLDDNRISGSTSAALAISNVQDSDVGGYNVVVSNILSAVTSSSASLTPLRSPTSSVRFVNLNSTTPAPPYLSWAAAATNIQDAIEAAVAGDSIFVTNGLYQSGGRVAYGALTNRVAVNKAITLQSVNGPGSTFIQGNRGIGDNAVRCVYLTNNATLVGFTLMNGATRNSGDVIKEQSGGGAWCESTNSALLNCLLVSNSVAKSGGGVFSGTSSNCTFVFNIATNGGAAFGGVLNNCLLITNSAINGGGSCSNALNGCSLIANKASGFGAGAYGSFLNACVVAANTNANQGAGIHSSTAVDCTISNNICSANSGGGAYASSLTNCSISGNIANRGGGIFTCILKNSQLVGNRATDGTGGAGAFQSTLFNSVIAGNQATLGTGGGGYGCTFDNCLVSSNSAEWGGAGAYNSTLNNCTVVGHTNNYGVYTSTLKNSIVYYNAANYFSGSLINCCATPVFSGQGNFTNAPRFLNMVVGNFRLQSDSPCINAGNNSYVTNVFDLDDGPRIFLGTVDVGAYEFRGQDNGSFAEWLQKYGLSTDGSNDFTDADGDGANNWQEWRADTIPTNSQSVFSLLNPVRGPTGFVVTWQSQNTRTYCLERSTNLAADPQFLMLATNIAGQFGLTSYTDTNVVGDSSVFYRVGVQLQAGFSVISYAWLQRYGLPTDGSADFSDADGDGANNWQEWRADTIPTNSLSLFRMLNATNSPSGAKVTWQSVSTRNYSLERATNLALASPFQTIAANIVGVAGVKTFTDTGATNGGPYFYRVRVQ